MALIGGMRLHTDGITEIKNKLLRKPSFLDSGSRMLVDKDVTTRVFTTSLASARNLQAVVGSAESVLGLIYRAVNKSATWFLSYCAVILLRYRRPRLN